MKVEVSKEEAELIVAYIKYAYDVRKMLLGEHVKITPEAKQRIDRLIRKFEKVYLGE